MMRPLRMLDLFCGLRGASAAMADRGWEVVGLDLAKVVAPHIVADVRRSPIRVRPGYFDLVWFSPPCDDYARKWLPWIQSEEPLDDALDLVRAGHAIALAQEPRLGWVCENTRFGGREIPTVLGAPVIHIGGWVFWGEFPLVMFPQTWKRAEKFPPSPMRPWLRSKIPYAISEAFALAFERAALSPRRATVAATVGDRGEALQ